MKLKDGKILLLVVLLIITELFNKQTATESQLAMIFKLA